MAITVWSPTYGDINIVPIWANAGAPTNNVTLLGFAKVGDLLSNTTNGTVYRCTVSTATTITWVTP